MCDSPQELFLTRNAIHSNCAARGGRDFTGQRYIFPLEEEVNSFERSIGQAHAQRWYSLRIGKTAARPIITIRHPNPVQTSR